MAAICSGLGKAEAGTAITCRELFSPVRIVKRD